MIKVLGFARYTDLTTGQEVLEMRVTVPNGYTSIPISEEQYSGLMCIAGAYKEEEQKKAVQHKAAHKTKAPYPDQPVMEAAQPQPMTTKASVQQQKTTNDFGDMGSYEQEELVTRHLQASGLDLSQLNEEQYAAVRNQVRETLLGGKHLQHQAPELAGLAANQAQQKSGILQKVLSNNFQVGVAEDEVQSI